MLLKYLRKLVSKVRAQQVFSSLGKDLSDKGAAIGLGVLRLVSSGHASTSVLMHDGKAGCGILILGHLVQGRQHVETLGHSLIREQQKMVGSSHCQGRRHWQG